MAGKDGDEILPVNTDADRSAAAIAAALDATLVLLTDVEGIYEDPDDPATLIETVETGEEWEDLEDAAEGFMGRKVMAAEEAPRRRVPRGRRRRRERRRTHPLGARRRGDAPLRRRARRHRGG